MSLEISLRKALIDYIRNYILRLLYTKRILILKIGLSSSNLS